MTRIKRTLKNVKVNAVVFALSLIVTLVTRKIFIDHLGNDVVGLSSMMLNILGFFSLAEVGITGAIAFALYKPLYTNDRGEVNNIISIFGYLYDRVGRIILGSALFFSLFLTLVFKNSNVETGYVYASFFVFLFSSLLGYFLNYKQMILVADQRNYIVVSYLNICNLVKFIVQSLTLVYTDYGYYMWLVWEAVFACLNSIMLRRRVRRDYGWVKSDHAEGKRLVKEYPDIMRRAKQVFSHNIATFILTQTDTILIYAFTSLSWVTIFTNYTMITSKLTQFMYMIFSNSNATVGNLIAEDNKPKIYAVFWQWMSLRYLIGVTIVFSLYRLADQFIVLWVGSQYLLDDVTFAILLVNVFIVLTRATVDSYLAGFGMFKDTWAPWLEAAMNLAISIGVGYFWGIKGIVLGTMISLILIIGLWKPYFLFREGFNRSVRQYWKRMSVYLSGALVLFFGLNYLFDILMPDVPQNYVEWAVNALLVSSLMFLCYGTYLYFTTQGMRDLCRVGMTVLKDFVDKLKS